MWGETGDLRGETHCPIFRLRIWMSFSCRFVLFNVRILAHPEAFSIWEGFGKRFDLVKYPKRLSSVSTWLSKRILKTIASQNMLILPGFYRLAETFELQIPRRHIQCLLNSFCPFLAYIPVQSDWPFNFHSTFSLSPSFPWESMICHMFGDVFNRSQGLPTSLTLSSLIGVLRRTKVSGSDITWREVGKSSDNVGLEDRPQTFSGCRIEFDWNIHGRDRGLSPFWREEITRHMSFKVMDNS
jgi:hypothetical protein